MLSIENERTLERGIASLTCAIRYRWSDPERSVELLEKASGYFSFLLGDGEARFYIEDGVKFANNRLITVRRECPHGSEVMLNPFYARITWLSESGCDFKLVIENALDSDCDVSHPAKLETSPSKLELSQVSRGPVGECDLFGESIDPPLYVLESRCVPKRVDNLNRIPLTHTAPTEHASVRVIVSIVRYLYSTHPDAHSSASAALASLVQWQGGNE